MKLLRPALTVLTALFAAPLAAACQNAPAPVYAYTDSEKSLKQLIEALQDAAAKNDAERFRALAEPLYFAGHEAWFKEIFGDRLGGYASANYASQTSDFVGSMRAAFTKLAQDGYQEPQVQEVNEPCSVGVLENEYPTLFARKEEVPLYSVRYPRGKKYQGLGFFIYEQNAFRYVGHVDLRPPPSGTRPGVIRVGGNVQQARLIHRPNPKYPIEARYAGIKGTVRLLAIVGKDGVVQDLQLISGHCWLAKASIAAVSQWRYKPTLLNGEPVEVQTTIDVVFTLSR